MNLRSTLSLLLAGFVATGCLFHHRAPTPTPTPVQTPPPVSTQPPIVTPDNSFTGKVVRYNSVGRFVVISFAVNQMPQAGQTLFLYRAGIKVGEIKITGPQRDSDTVADVTTGDAQPGDDVRSQ
jgi:hypothetical protein